MTREDEIRRGLEGVLARIRAAEREAHRAEGSVTLLPVTKFHPASDVEILRGLGVTDVGENREQEARQKSADVPGVRFHMIGQVQTKKANAVARWAAACHSVDSVKLAEGLDRGMGLALERGDRDTEVMDCFIQWSADGDVSRGGAVEGDVEKLAETLADASHLRLAGLMVVPPIGADPSEVFARARQLTDSLGDGLRLSAGMSGDLEKAVREGSDVVRVGTDILGPRPLA